MRKKESRPTESTSNRPEENHYSANCIAPWPAGLPRQLEAAEAGVAAAPDWQTAREGRRAANLLRRRLRPAPVDGGAAALEAIRASQVNAIVSWAESQSGGGR